MRYSEQLISYERPYGVSLMKPIGSSMSTEIARVGFNGKIAWLVPFYTRYRYKQVYECSREFKKELETKRKMLDEARVLFEKCEKGSNQRAAMSIVIKKLERHIETVENCVVE